MYSEIDNSFKDFMKEMTEINAFTQFIIKKSVSNYDKYLQEQCNLIEENKVNINDNIASIRAVYFDIDNNITIDNFKLDYSINELKDLATFHYNKQLQWLLVEAYEIYEKYIIKLYCILGYYDNNFWSLKDFGEKQFSDIKNQNIDAFKEIAKKNQLKVYKIEKIFYKRFNFKENNNLNSSIPDMDYKFLIKLISELRNSIVHEKGVSNKNNLITKVLNYSDKNSDKEKFESFINIFFGKNKYKDCICLNIIEGSTPFHNIDRFDFLTKTLLSYANLLKEHSIIYLKLHKLHPL